MYNEFFENTGECEYSFYLGCKKCPKCKVREYQKKVREQMELKHKKEQEMLEEIWGEC